MAGVVGVWIGEFTKIGRRETARGAAGSEDVVGRCRQGEDGMGPLPVESGKKGACFVVQEKRRRNSGVLADSEAVACMLMDRFAPA